MHKRYNVAVLAYDVWDATAGAIIPIFDNNGVSTLQSKILYTQNFPFANQFFLSSIRVDLRNKQSHNIYARVWFYGNVTIEIDKMYIFNVSGGLNAVARSATIASVKAAFSDIKTYYKTAVTVFPNPSTGKLFV
jgi:hypothetical protein